MLKTTESSKLLAPKVLGANDNEIVGGSGSSRADKTVKNSSSNIGTTEEPTFLIPGAKEAFTQLRQVFTKAQIIQHFDLECHIRI